MISSEPPEKKTDKSMAAKPLMGLKSIPDIFQACALLPIPAHKSKID